jgi:pyruvate dehydrogenase E2 component (dihydrolipoamide acetyltransferase)
VAIEVIMPKWGLTMKEGKISRWFKAEGDAVRKGEPLFEVETSKITNKVDSPGDGILFQIVIAAGETVPVKTVVAVLAAPGEQPERLAPVAGEGAEDRESSSAAAGRQVESGRFVPATPIARRLAKEWGIDLARVAGTGPNGRVIEKDVRAFRETGASPVDISPQAKKLADDAGIDPSAIQGTGKDGRITKADVLRAMNPACEESAAPSAPAPTTGSTAPGIFPLAGIRKVIAENMMASLHGSAQLTVFVEVDVTALTALRDRLRQKFSAKEDVKISYNDLIALAVCRTLRDFPIMNSWLAEESIMVHDHVNLGVAVALPDGLIVPNVKNAHEKSLLELAVEMRRLSARARDGQLTIDEIQGGTFTITNVSMLGIDGFTPILNPPETAILGIGRALDKPAVFQGRICVRKLMTLSLTFDHRVVDGAPAMRFLRGLADYLEEPAMMMV